MGEALITRRGGSVKRGTMANLATSSSSNSISDPALIGAKDAMVYAACSKSLTDSTGSSVYLSFSITNGVLEKVSYLFSSEIKVDSTKTLCSFDSTTGTISRMTEGSGIPLWGKVNGTAKAVPYEYIVFD